MRIRERSSNVETVVGNRGGKNGVERSRMELNVGGMVVTQFKSCGRLLGRNDESFS